MKSDLLREFRKQMLDELEKKMLSNHTPEDDAFYYHKSEERIVLSHALFWVMTHNQKGKVAKEEYFLLLRMYEEEMLEAYLTEDETFPELLRYCNIIFNTFPSMLCATHDVRTDREAKKLSAIFVVACGHGGDMPDDLAEELLDDIDFYYNKVKCRKIEQMLPILNKYVAEEMQMMG